MASAIVVPVFSERIARPGRLSSRCVTASAEASANTQISTYRPRPVPRLKPASVIGGTPRMPSYLPRNSMLEIV